MVKTYELLYLRSLSTTIKVNGKDMRITFSGNSASKGSITTSNPDVQKGIESSPAFGIKFKIKPGSVEKSPIKGPGKAIVGAVTSEKIKGKGILAGEVVNKDKTNAVDTSPIEPQNPVEEPENIETNTNPDNIDLDKGLDTSGDVKEEPEITEADADSGEPSEAIIGANDVGEPVGEPKEMAFANLITLRDYLSSTFHVPKSLLMSYAEAEAIALKFGIKPVFERK